MANQKTILIVAIVAVVAIAAVGVYFLTQGNNDGGDSKDPSEYLTPGSGTAVVNSVDTKMMIFGNANNDVYLDKSDVQFIQDIVDKKTSWNKSKNPFADTNADGAITIEDVKLLQAFIDGKTAPMFYTNSKLQTCQITFPLTGDVVISQALDADMLKILGKYNLIKAYSGSPVDPEKYPESKNWVSVGSYPYDYEKVVAAGIDITLGQPYDYDETFDDLVKKGYKSYRLDTVKLHEARLMNGVESVACTVTLGGLMNCFGVSTYKAYLDYVANINDILDKATSGISTAKTYALILTHGTSSPSSVAIDNMSTAEQNYADVAMVENIKMTNAVPATNEGYITGLSIEDVLKYKPDVIFIEESKGSATKAEYHANVEQVAGWLKEAGYSGQIIGIHWSVCGSTASTAALPLLATFIYGNSSYSEDSAWNDLVTYYNSFLGASYTVSQIKETTIAPYVVL